MSAVRGHVLIVDDHPEVLQVLREALCRASYRILTATNAEQALCLLSANPDIDLVLAEVLLPGMRGTELVRCIRRCHPSAAIILMSGYTDCEVVDPSTPLLRKPFGVRELMDVVRRNRRQ